VLGLDLAVAVALGDILRRVDRVDRFFSKTIGIK
jgi:hypothetical protein